MDLQELIDQLLEETSGARAEVSGYMVLFEDKEGVEHQIGEVLLSVGSQLLMLIERKD